MAARKLRVDLSLVAIGRRGRPDNVRRRAVTLAHCSALLLLVLTVAACGSSPTGPSRTAAVLESLTVVGSSGGGVVLHRDETATGTVRLTGNAPAGGAVVALTVDGAESRALIVPVAVTIPAGSSNATFPVTVTSSGVSAPTEVTLNAVYRNVRQSFVIRLEPLR